MRIAFVVHGFPPLESAGVELVASEQASALASRGHAVEVFARGYGPGHEATDEMQGEVRVLRVGAPVGSFPDLASTWDNHAFDEAFDRFLDEARPDVVHFQHTVMLSPNLIGRVHARGLPTVLTLHDAWHLCHRLYLLDRDGLRCEGPEEGARCGACLADLGGASTGRARFDFMARALASVDRVLAPSRALAARHETQWPFLAGRVVVADPGLANPPARREGRSFGAGRPGDPLRLVFVGTWLPHKGLDLLVRVAARLDPARFRLAVHGAGVAGREAWVEALREETRGLPVEWRGVFTPERLEDVLGEADVLVLPSRCDESWSRAVREARAAGLAVVAPSTGGPGELLVDGEDALLVEPASEESLHRALVRLLDDPALVRRLADAPARWTTSAEAAASLEDEYRAVIERHAATAARRSLAGAATSRAVAEAGTPRPTVSVVYPTKNAGPLLDASLAAVRRQGGAFELLEVVAVDSGSTDGTLQVLERHGVRVLRIAPGEFGHGRTRNLGAREARGEIVVFLTQDAEPADDRWLDRLVAPLAADPMLAGAWSRHRARPGCHPMERRRIEEFPLFDDRPLVTWSLRGGSVAAFGDELAAWFSNNASAIRREVLLRHPFPDVEFAEDQAWARAVLRAGYRTALVNESIVLHSHDYGAWENLRRHFDHARAMRETMGREDPITLREAVRCAVHETGRDVSYEVRSGADGRLATLARWGVPAIAYHLGAFGGRWLGARSGRLPESVRNRLSLHAERVGGRTAGAPGPAGNP